MFTLTYPLILPDGHAFRMDDQYAVPLICGEIAVSCSEYAQGFPQVLTFSGFTSAEQASEFSATVGKLLQCATIYLKHGLRVSEVQSEISGQAVYDANRPTIFQSSLNPKTIQAGSLSMLSIDHISNLASEIERQIDNKCIDRIRAWPELAFAIELFSELEFSGGHNARFIALFSVVEILVLSTRGNKRGHATRLVKRAHIAAGRHDSKNVTKQFDELYAVRNALVHEGSPVSASQVTELSVVVRDTLDSLLRGLTPPPAVCHKCPAS